MKPDDRFDRFALREIVTEGGQRRIRIKENGSKVRVRSMPDVREDVQLHSVAVCGRMAVLMRVTPYS